MKATFFFSHFLAIAIKKIACDAAYSQSCRRKRQNFLHNTINRSNCCLKEPILRFAPKSVCVCMWMFMWGLRLFVCQITPNPIVLCWNRYWGHNHDILLFEEFSVPLYSLNFRKNMNFQQFNFRIKSLCLFTEKCESKHLKMLNSYFWFIIVKMFPTTHSFGKSLSYSMISIALYGPLQIWEAVKSTINLQKDAINDLSLHMTVS